MKEFTYVGKSVNRVDALQKVTGGAIYGDDVSLPGMLYGKTLRSKYASARILDIDTTRARRLAGVVAVVTGRDIPAVFGNPRVGIADQPFLAIDKVRYQGEAVAAVAAIDANLVASIVLPPPKPTIRS